MENIDTAPLPEKPVFWQHFSKRTLALIVILLVITGGLLYLAISENQPQAVSVAPKPTTSPAHTILSLTPETSSTSALSIVDVVAQSNGNSLSGVQLNLSYDPAVLTNVTIKPGTYFTNPAVLFNTVDKINGRISYVLAIQPTGKSVSGNGTIATITYSLSPTASASTTLGFLPKTEVTQLGVSGSVLKTTKNLVIQIPAAFIISPTSHL